MTNDEEMERLRTERDACKAEAVRLMDENRNLVGQPAKIAWLERELDDQRRHANELRALLRDVVGVLVRPLVGKKLRGRNRARGFVDISRVVAANQQLLDAAAREIQLLDPTMGPRTGPLN